MAVLDSLQMAIVEVIEVNGFPVVIDVLVDGIETRHLCNSRYANSRVFSVGVTGLDLAKAPMFCDTIDAVRSRIGGRTVYSRTVKCRKHFMIEKLVDVESVYLFITGSMLDSYCHSCGHTLEIIKELINGK